MRIPTKHLSVHVLHALGGMHVVDDVDVAIGMLVHGRHVLSRNRHYSVLRVHELGSHFLVVDDSTG